MTDRVYQSLLILLSTGFALAFTILVIPALIEQPDIPAAFAAGFVNPFASGYATDAIICWLILLVWVLYERSRYGVKHGWLCLLLGVAPGVATGFGLYLLLRERQGVRTLAGS